VSRLRKSRLPPSPLELDPTQSRYNKPGEEGLAERKLTLDVTPAAAEFLANEGFDPVYGARPLKRAIQRRVLDPLSLELLEGKFHEGDHIVVDVDGGKLVFRKSAAPAAAAA
jgi:ATP-dependent Clp protease ATP-binding subunit ClpA